MSALRKSLAISFAEKYSALVIQFGTTLVIARILSPKDFGIFSVGAAIIAIAHTLRDFGVTNYLIQEKHLSDAIIRTAFGLALTFAWSIAGILYWGRPWVAAFYGEPAIQDILSILVWNFLILPFANVSSAILRREMRFGAIYAVNIFSTLAQSATAIFLAIKGFGFMSLAWGGIAGVVGSLLMVTLIQPKYALILPSFKHTGKVLSFGGQSTLASLINELGSNASDLIVSKVLGFTAAGHLSRANGLVNLAERTLTDVIRPVIFPYFAVQHRTGQDVRTSYLKAVQYYLAVLWPLLAIIGFTARPLIHVLYGPQWEAAVPLVQILCVAVGFRAANHLTAAATLALGGARQLIQVQSAYQLIKVACIVAGSVYGIEEAARALVLAEFAGFFSFYWSCRTILGLNLRAYTLPLGQALIILLFAAAGPATVHWFFGDSLDWTAMWLQIGLASGGGVLGSLAGILVTHHPLLQEFGRIKFRKLEAN